MKFSKENMHCKKDMKGFEVWELQDRAKFPIDGAIVKIENGVFPLKINHGFYALFYIIKGSLELEVEGKVEVLNGGDFYILEPELRHRMRADYAEMIEVCHPPFDVKNVEIS